MKLFKAFHLKESAKMYDSHVATVLFPLSFFTFIIGCLVLSPILIAWGGFFGAFCIFGAPQQKVIKCTT